MNQPNRKRARQLAADSIARGDALGWFETLYAHAGEDPSAVPWADMVVNRNLTEWATRRNLTGRGKAALVVGCGLGDDAEFLASLGFDVTAFDISPTAIAWCGRRFPSSQVRYQAVDLFSAPAAWQQAFDFVFEAYTVQVFQGDLRERAARVIGQFVRPGGTLLVVARGRDPHDDPGQMPWPLTHAELGAFAAAGLREERFEDYLDDEDPPVRRFRAEYAKP